MQLTRRDALLLGGSALALTALPMPALAATEGVDETEDPGRCRHRRIPATG